MEDQQDQPPARASGELNVMAEQEAALRRMLGGEDEYLVDLVQAGMDASDFIQSRTGKAMLKELMVDTANALQALCDPTVSPEETLQAAYKLRVSYAATKAICGTISEGRAAEAAIDART